MQHLFKPQCPFALLKKGIEGPTTCFFFLETTLSCYAASLYATTKGPRFSKMLHIIFSLTKSSLAALAQKLYFSLFFQVCRITSRLLLLAHYNRTIDLNLFIAADVHTMWLTKFFQKLNKKL